MSPRFQDKGEKDLFDQIPFEDKTAMGKAGVFFEGLKKNVTIAYENIIFLIITVIILSVILFTLGVKKGRQDIKIVTSDEGQDVKITEKIQPEKKEEENKSNYMIQLAAFKNKWPAEQQKDRLNEEQYNAKIKKTGNYYQLYIDGFSGEIEAQRALRSLKARYRDCYIRKL